MTASRPLSYRDEIVFSASRNPVDDRVADAAEHLAETRIRFGGSLLRLLHPAREALRLRNEFFLFFLGGRSDLLAEGVLLGAQLFECADGCATLSVGLESLVDEFDGITSRLLRTLEEVRVFAEKNWIDHPLSLSTDPTELGSPEGNG